MSNDDKLIQGHEYDGIQELDNPLPGWWLFTFYGAIVYAVGYVAYYWFLGGPSHDEQLAKAMAGITAAQEKVQAQEEQQTISIEDFQAVASDSDLMAAAKTQYDTKCAACHAPKGEGLVGPNLTDKYWISSKGDEIGILEAIQKGFPDKGMPPWKELIPEKEQLALAVYVKNFKEVSGKAPQGDLVE